MESFFKTAWNFQFYYINFKVLMSRPNFQFRLRLPRSSSHSIFAFHWRCKNSCLCISGFTPWLLQLPPCWHFCTKSACSKYPCPRCSSKTLLLSHHSGSDWLALAPGLPANRVQNCYHCFQGVALPIAFWPCWNSFKIHFFTNASRYLW